MTVSLDTAVAKDEMYFLSNLYYISVSPPDTSTNEIYSIFPPIHYHLTCSLFHSHLRDCTVFTASSTARWTVGSFIGNVRAGTAALGVTDRFRGIGLTGGRGPTYTLPNVNSPFCLERVRVSISRSQNREGKANRLTT